MDSRGTHPSHENEQLGISVLESIGSTSHDERTKASPTVAIIVLNWNGWGDTIECLESLQNIDYQEYLTIVVDNNSQDNSVTHILEWAKARMSRPGAVVHYTKDIALLGGKERAEARLEEVHAKQRLVVISNEANLGFTGGNNVAIQYALIRAKSARYVFVLNNDATVMPDTLSRLVGVAEDTRAGIVAPLVVREDGRRIDAALRYVSSTIPQYFFSPLLRSPEIPVTASDRLLEAFVVNGAAMLIRSDAIRDVYRSRGQYFAERLFLYHEELDLCNAVRNAGYSCGITGAATAIHKVSRSAGGWDSAIKSYYMTRNRMVLANQLLGSLCKGVFHIVNLQMCIARVFLYGLRGRWRAAVGILCALGDAYKGVDGKWIRHDSFGPQRAGRGAEKEYDP